MALGQRCAIGQQQAVAAGEGGDIFCHRIIGDGIVDGYYTSDGFYHPYVAPAPAAPAPRYLSRRGERG